MRRRQKRKHKYLVNFILLFLISSIIIWVEIQIIKETNIEYQYQVDKLALKQNISNENLKNNNSNTENINNNNFKNENLNNTYKGYDVCAILEIPKINLKTYILSNYSEKALNVSVAKFWGAQPNEIGNFCVVGHNFINTNMFHNLKKLKIGDNLYITNLKNIKIEYEVFDIYKVLPNDTSCLSQVTNGKRETTLITCTNDSSQRVIIKAREKS